MRIRKLFAGVMIAAALSMITVVSSFAAPVAVEDDSYVWTKVNDEWTCVDEDGKPVKGWAVHDDETYFMNKDGIMKTGWIKVENDWYYLDEETGVLAKDVAVDGQYQVDSDGKMVGNKFR
jgi:glucan-binding YG repeat protein